MQPMQRKHLDCAGNLVLSSQTHMTVLNLKMITRALRLQGRLILRCLLGAVRDSLDLLLDKGLWITPKSISSHGRFLDRFGSHLSKRLVFINDVAPRTEPQSRCRHHSHRRTSVTDSGEHAIVTGDWRSPSR